MSVARLLTMLRKRGGAGWWNPDGDLPVVAAYQPKGAASLAASYVDLSGGGNAMVTVIPPTWDATNGWKFNGIDQYVDSGVTPATDVWSGLIQFTDVTNTGRIFGLYDFIAGSWKWFGMTGDSGTDRVIYVHSSNRQVIPKLLAGNLGFAAQQGYRNGVKDGALMIAHLTPFGPGGVHVGCAFRQPATRAFWGAVYVQAFVIYSDELAEASMLAVATAMAAL